MKRTIAVAFVSGIAISLLTGCGNATDETAASTSAEVVTAETVEGTSDSNAEETSETEDLAERTTFTVGFDANFPPYGYTDDDGGYTGFDLELAQAVCDLEGWELVKQPIDWDAKDMELSSSAIDCIWNGFTINGREEDYTWSDPYIDNSQVYVVYADSDIETPDDLAGMNVGVQKDSSALAALDDESNADLLASFGNLTEYDDYNTAFMDLEAGGVDCVAMDIGVAAYQISSRGDSFRILDDYLSSEQYGIGFRLGDTALRDEVQADLYTLYDNGTVTELADKYDLTDYLCMDEYENQ